MSELETAIGPAIRVFSRHAVSEGSDWRLGKGELKMLTEVAPKSPKGKARQATGGDTEGLNKLGKELYTHRDAQVDFSEFVSVAALTCLSLSLPGGGCQVTQKDAE
ncbi:protein S100-P [Meriones unguiculatus]|uniref:protein S100-P n=1 Tax=Meriones unguiculatus TaxID=10047 RepID=UPI000B4F5B1A|nr:protein S100-P [Meriones unguiculatus]